MVYGITNYHLWLDYSFRAQISVSSCFVSCHGIVLNLQQYPVIMYCSKIIMNQNVELAMVTKLLGVFIVF